MKKIIVPVDFSKPSQDAYRYALQLAPIFEAEIEVVHAYSGSFSPSEPLVIKSGKSREQVLMDQLELFTEVSLENENSETLTKNKVKLKILEGAVATSVINYAKAEKAFMIVMGTTGSHDLIEKTMGSISTAVAQKAPCTVLLIPKDKSFEGWKNVLFATDYQAAEPQLLNKGIRLTRDFEAVIHLVHVNQDDGTESVVLHEKIFNRLFEKGDPNFSFNLLSIDADSVVKGLTQYAMENDIDCIALINHRERFWDNVLQKSTTKQMGLYTTFPLLVFQDKE
ncbi:MAG: universal stress protein [Bacteroidota bacterium]